MQSSSDFTQLGCHLPFLVLICLAELISALSGFTVIKFYIQGPIKAEPGGSIDSPSVTAVEGGPGNSDPMDVDGTTEIPTEKSTVLKVNWASGPRPRTLSPSCAGSRQRGLHLRLEPQAGPARQRLRRQHGEDLEPDAARRGHGGGAQALHQCGGQGGA